MSDFDWGKVFIFVSICETVGTMDLLCFQHEPRSA